MLSRTACLVALAGLAFNAISQPVGQIEPEPGAKAENRPVAGPTSMLRPEDGPEISPEIPTTASFFTGITYLGASDTKGSAGEIRTVRIPARFRYSTPLDNKNIIGVDFSQVSSFYDFQPFSEFPGSGDPIDYGVAATIGVSIIHIVDRQLSFIAAINGGFAGEIDAEFEDSISIGGIAGIRYQYNQNLNIGANLIIQSRLEEDIIAFPVPTVDWDFSDYWNFKFGSLNQLPAELAGGIAVTHKLTEGIDVGGFSGVTFREFRLADDNSSAPAGILEDATVPLGAFLVYSYSPNVTIAGSMQAVVWREINLRNRSGGNIADVELQPTLAASLAVQFKL